MTSVAPVRIALVGCGRISRNHFDAIVKIDGLELAAVCDIIPERAREAGRRFGVPSFESIDEMLASVRCDAVALCTPSGLHPKHGIIAARAGKHVICEKPMAISLQEAEQMVEAADRNKVKVLAGHTQSYSLPIRAMRKIITSGRIGGLRALHIWAYSDWMLRPRTSDELDPNQGGGIPYRQGPHQIDTVRVLGGGKLRSVRAMTGRWDAARPIPGYYSAYLEFEDGTPATLVYSGYAHFDSAELHYWVGEGGQARDPLTNVNTRARLREVGAVKDDVGAELAAIGDLNERGELRHHDGRRDPEELRVVGDPLRVIAGRGRDHPALARVRRQLEQRIARAAFLEAARALQVVELAVDVRAGQLRQRNRLDARRVIDAAGNPVAGGFDIGERHHDSS